MSKLLTKSARHADQMHVRTNWPDHYTASSASRPEMLRAAKDNGDQKLPFAVCARIIIELAVVSWAVIGLLVWFVIQLN